MFTSQILAEIVSGKGFLCLLPPDNLVQVKGSPGSKSLPSPPPFGRRPNTGKKGLRLGLCLTAETSSPVVGVQRKVIQNWGPLASALSPVKSFTRDPSEGRIPFFPVFLFFSHVDQHIHSHTGVKRRLSEGWRGQCRGC